jgi:hypothetical protein
VTPLRALVAAAALLVAAAAGVTTGSAPAAAQVIASSPWRLVEAGRTRTVAKSALAVTPAGDWNRSTRRPTKRAEVWTRDGTGLDELDFFAAIPKGKPLFREQHKKKAPLPKFDPAMLPTDIVEWFENSARIVLGGALFTISEVRPAKLAGADGVHFAYSYASEGDNLERRGEVRAAVIGGKLYLINFDAAKIHYFDAHIGEVRALMDSARMVGN